MVILFHKPIVVLDLFPAFVIQSLSVALFIPSENKLTPLPSYFSLFLDNLISDFIHS